MAYELSHLRVLEAESIHIIREVAAEFERPVPAVLRRQGLDRDAPPRREGVLARPAPVPGDARRHRPQLPRGARVPRPARRRARRAAGRASVQDVDRRGPGASRRPGPAPSRNRLQTATLLDAIEEHRFDAVFGGARRDEEKARAKERVSRFRDEFGQWDPKNQRPELWSLYNGRHRQGEHIRVFPLSNWTELDIWQYIGDEDIELPVDLLRAPARGVPPRRHAARASARSCTLLDGEEPFEATVRYRTVGDVTCTGAVESAADTVDEGHRRGRRHPHHRARGDPRRRPGQRGRHGRPQARGVLLMELLRFATAGSVDDGKITLIGRLLYDTKSIFEDQLEAVERTSAADAATSTPTSRCSPTACAPSASRASRSTSPTATSPRPKRKFIIADTPGHVQYTRNMVTGASTADLALILVDARKGVLEQTRRHAFIASLLRVPHLVLCVNKMDLVDYDQDVFDAIKDEFRALRDEARHHRPDVHPDLRAARRQRRRPLATTCPGTRARRCCTTSRTCTSPRTATSSTRASRCSTCIRPMNDEHHDYRGYAGQVAGGIFKPGDEVIVLPSGFTSRDRGDRHRRRPGRRGVPADVGHRHARPTTSTSAAAT